MASKKIVIVPAYNEEKTIRRIVNSVRETYPDIDLVVVDDGSIDNTARLARGAGAVVLRHAFNIGYGGALQTGYKYAHQNNYEYILQMDADGQHEPVYLKNLLEELMRGEADVVIGSRYLKDKSYRAPFLRKAGMRFFSVLTSMIVRQKISDPTSGFLGFRRSVLKLLLSDYFPVDYPDADFIIMLHKQGFSIKEIPVMMRADSIKSMHSGIKSIYYIFKMLLSVLVVILRKN